jgi:protein-tyrosine phosphatase
MRPFAVLVVCTGNECRSPVAAHVLREVAVEVSAAMRRASTGHASGGQAAEGRAAYHLEVISAGTQATPGRPIHPLTARAMHAVGLAVPAHASAALALEPVLAADLILTAERSHRTTVAALDNGAVAKTFTLLEFAALVRHVGAEAAEFSPPRLVAACAQLRASGAAAGWNGQSLDLPDPVRGDADLHLAVLHRVLELGSDIGRTLTQQSGLLAHLG